MSFKGFWRRLWKHVDLRGHETRMLLLCLDILHLLFWDLAPLEPSFDVNLSRWSQSRALQGMAEPEHTGARILTGACSPP